MINFRPCRKKAIVEAAQFNPDKAYEFPMVLQRSVDPPAEDIDEPILAIAKVEYYIPTLEGDMKVEPDQNGEWPFIMRGVAGEYYACKASVFKETYAWC